MNKKMKEKIDAELESIRKELALTKQEIQTFPDRPPTPSYTMILWILLR